MDYVEWCDSVANALADYAEQNNRSVHLHPFASHFTDLQSRAGVFCAYQTVILDAAEVLSACGITSRHSPSFHLTFAEIAHLRDQYGRWMYAQSIPLDDSSLLLLATLNQLSKTARGAPATVAYVDLNLIVSEVGRDPDGLQIDAELAMELLDGLENFGLDHSHKTSGLTEYKSSYLGVARTKRTHVAQDYEIDLLRTAGEGDNLDYKRTYKLKSDAEKWEFAKDVTALANAGGVGPRRLLLGVEDNGEFYRPASTDETTEHRALLDDITETRLQQILTSRTTHSPSVRIAAQGEHREGPYILIEISRDVSHLPYRIYRSQADRTDPSAHENGEVWVRKGSTKALATPAEIESLEQQAALSQRTQSFH